MLTTPPEQIDSALGRLEPGDRALLELSLGRHVPDDEIAGLLHVERDDVERRRSNALDRLAHDVDAASTNELADLLQDTWSNGGNGAPATAVPVEPGAEPLLPDLEPEGGPLQAGRRGFLVVGILVLAMIVAVVVAVIRLGGKDEAATHPAAPVRPAPAPSASPRVPLRPVVAAAQGIRGTAQLRGGSVRMSVRGLPAARGDYTVWLYDSVENALPLGNLRDGKLTAKLPRDYARFRSLDVSIEPRDGNANHSGASVLRAPVSALTR
jgi:Anti-sigma-K factor rskA